MTPWFAPPGGSWFMELSLSIPDLEPDPPGSRVIAYPTGGNITPLYLDNTKGMGQYDGSNGMHTANLLTVNTIAKAATTFASGILKTNACLNAWRGIQRSIRSSVSRRLQSAGVQLASCSRQWRGR